MPSRKMSPPASSRWDRLLPWAVSVTLNIGFWLVAAFIIYVVPQAFSASQADSIIAPSSFEDPSLSQHPGGGTGAVADPTRDARDRLKDLARSQGWSQSDSMQNVSEMLGGSNQAVGIFAGNGASVAPGKGSSLSAYGAPTAGAGGGPHSTFYGTGGNAVKIVYLIDTSGSMLGGFKYVQDELTRSVNKLVPLQFFCVIAVGTTDRHSAAVGPGELLRATPENKKNICDKIMQLAPEGPNDGVLEPFANAFQMAFELKPELIYFLADGKSDPALSDYVTHLNADHRVIVNSLSYEELGSDTPSDAKLQAIVRETRTLDRVKTLQEIAQRNGGIGKLVFENPQFSYSVDMVEHH